MTQTCSDTEDPLVFSAFTNRISIAGGSIGSVFFAGVTMWFWLGRGHWVVACVLVIGVPVAAVLATRGTRVSLEMCSRGARIRNQFSTTEVDWADVLVVETRNCWRPLWQANDLGMDAVTFVLRSGKRLQSEATLNVRPERSHMVLAAAQAYAQRAHEPGTDSPKGAA